jgi:hypothetical protein
LLVTAQAGCQAFYLGIDLYLLPQIKGGNPSDKPVGFSFDIDVRSTCG